MVPGEASAVVMALGEELQLLRVGSVCGAPGVFPMPWMDPRAQDGKVGMVLEGSSHLPAREMNRVLCDALGTMEMVVRCC